MDDSSSSAEQANIPRYITADPVDPSSLSFRATDAKRPAAATRNVVSDIMGKVVAGAQGVVNMVTPQSTMNKAAEDKEKTGDQSHAC
jgi:hypothetical protein